MKSTKRHKKLYAIYFAFYPYCKGSIAVIIFGSKDNNPLYVSLAIVLPI